MASYKEIKAQISKLEKLAESQRRTELKSVIAGIRKQIGEHGLTAEDLGLAGGTKARVTKSAKPRATASAGSIGVAKYRDPKTQKTWTGRGKPPGWIAKAKNRDAFLIDAPVAAPAAEAPKPTKSASRPAKVNDSVKAAKAPKVAKKSSAVKPARAVRTAPAKKAPKVPAKKSTKAPKIAKVAKVTLETETVAAPVPAEPAAT